MPIKHITGLIFFSAILLIQPVFAEKKIDKKIEARASIGSTFASPIAYEENLYFISTSGVLYKSKMDLTNPEIIFKGKKQSVSGLALSGSTLYWGEGLHDDKSTMLRAYDLKAKKMLAEVNVDGHIERGGIVHNNILYTGLGFGGVAAFKINTLEKIWQTKLSASKPIHADGNILFVENKICTTSIYDLKAILCFDPLNGKIINTFELKKNPKSEITSAGDTITGFATEANLNETKWNLPSDLYVVDVKNNKIKFEKELRGFNFFAPLIQDDLAYVTLSTGDFITVSLKNGSIGYIGEFAEPFINNPFMYKNNFCSIGIMGKFMCYSKNKNGYGIANDSRIFETPIGKFTSINGKIYAPSRLGYFIVE